MAALLASAWQHGSLTVLIPQSSLEGTQLSVRGTSRIRNYLIYFCFHVQVFSLGVRILSHQRYFEAGLISTANLSQKLK